MHNITKEIQAIVSARHEALQNLIKTSEAILDLVNTYGKCDGTEEEFDNLKTALARVRSMD